MKLPLENWEKSYKNNNTSWRITDPDIENILAKIDQPIKNALDLGCGTGEWSIALQKNGITVEGLDFSKEALKISKPQSDKVTWVNYDLENLDEYEFKHEKYDLIIDNKVLAFIEDKEKYLNTIKSKLSGIFVATIIHKHDNKHIVIKRDEFKELIKDKFKIIYSVQLTTRPGKEIFRYFLKLT